MQSCLTRSMITAAMFSAVAFNFCSAAEEPAATAEPPEPKAESKVPYADDEQIYAGDDVITLGDAPLIGDEEQTLLTLTKGLPLVARDIHEQWVMVDIYYQGQPVQGWVDRKHLALISPMGPGLLHPQIKDVPRRLAELHASSEEQLSRADFLKSLETCSAVLKIDPTSAVAFYRRGHCLRMLEEFDKAIADFNEALKLEPRYELALLARGDARFSLDDFDQAMADYDSVLAMNPHAAGAHYMRGRCWYQKGENDKAIGEYNAALQLDPDHSWALAHRGDAHFAKKDFDAAIADLDRATQIDREFDWAVARRGDVWFFGKNDLDRALADYTFAHVLNDHNSWAIHQRGHCLEKKHDYARAVIDYEEAVQIDPGYWDYATNLAWILSTCPDATVRNGEKAVELATQACELTDWKNSFSLGALAAANAEVGSYDKAIDLMKKAIEQKSEEYDLDAASKMLEVFRAEEPYRDAEAPVTPPTTTD